MKKVLFILITCALVSVTGCTNKNVKSPDEAAANARAARIGDQNLPPSEDITVVDDNIPVLPGMEEDRIIEAAEPEADIRTGEFAEASQFEPVYFTFDKYELADDAKKSAEKNAEQLKSFRKNDVLVEGHCDDRGTIEYNIALGQKRAKTVSDYYAGLGIEGDKLTTISYGKEKPVCAEATEDCWQRNRRAETKIRN